MLKWQEKHEDKEQGKTKHEAPRSINHKATQNKNNTWTTHNTRVVWWLKINRLMTKGVRFTILDSKRNAYFTVSFYLIKNNDILSFT